MVPIIAIAAVARNGVIGAGNDIPWRIREDLARFRTRTTGQVLVMGRRTYDSIGRPLPGRTTLVVTRSRGWRSEGAEAVPSVAQALDRGVALGPSMVYVAGGGEIYRAAWERLTGLEITEVDAEPSGDVTFPFIDPERWRDTCWDDHL